MNPISNHRDVAMPPRPDRDQDSFAVLFVHSRLDDYGLSPAQFRVYGHMSRRAGRGDAFPAIASIARACQLHPQTVRRALRFLVSQRLLNRTDHSGHPSHYRLTSVHEWLPHSRATGTPSATNPPPSTSANPSEQWIQDTPCESDAAKGNPTEVDPNKVIHSPPVPPPGERECSTAKSSMGMETEIYEAYPKKIGRPAAVRAIRAAIKRHSFAVVLERTRLYAATYNGESRYMPNPATFFNQDRFMDDPATWQRPISSNSKPQPATQFRREDYLRPTEKF